MNEYCKEEIKKMGLSVYRVGGSVRDERLGLQIKDRDYVVVGSTVEEMVEKGYKRVGNYFPVFIHPKTGEEFALARRERKYGHGHTGFEVDTKDVTIEEDLGRRDITINSIAIGDDGVLIDPCGGLKDLEDGLIKQNSGAFSDDPLRVLRVARFFARFYHLGFEVDSKTLSSMRSISKEELSSITQERVWIETEKALRTKNPEAYFILLKDVGVLEHVYPEIHDLIGKIQGSEFHAEGDAFQHSMMVLKVASESTEDTEIRFASLVHDLGKGVSLEEKLPRHIGHEKKGVDIIERMCDRLHTPRKYKDLGMIGSEFHLKHHLVFEMTPQKILKVLKRVDAFRKPSRFHQFLEVCRADYRGRVCKGENRRHDEYTQMDFMSECRSGIMGIEVQDLCNKGYERRRFIQELHRLRLNEIKRVRGNFRV